MKKVEEYKKSATMYLVPNLRNGSSLKVEFTVPASAVLYDIIIKLRMLGFSCTESTSYTNITEKSNVVDIALDLCIDEREVAHDLFTYLETVLGEGRVIDRVRTTIKNKKEVSHSSST